MTTQPEALRLAELFELESDPESQYRKAAAELRRLHAENEYIRSALKGWIKENSPGGWIGDLRAQRDALLEALKEAAEALEIAADNGGVNFYQYAKEARAAIKAVEETK
jgi:hypothetical protein